jgi:hypothetical protein
MQRITSVKELQQAIQHLESVQKQQAEDLKEQFDQTAASLNPRNLVMTGVKKILSSPVILLFGIEKIKEFGHNLIDLVFHRKEPVSGQD